jgi:hypothetical protein
MLKQILLGIAGFISMGIGLMVYDFQELMMTEFGINSFGHLTFLVTTMVILLCVVGFGYCFKTMFKANAELLDNAD